jgi:hypothetical protein
MNEIKLFITETKVDVILFLGGYNVRIWAMLQAFLWYILPSLSGSKCESWANFCVCINSCPEEKPLGNKVGVDVSTEQTGRLDQKRRAIGRINKLRTAPETNLILLGGGKHLGGSWILVFSKASTSSGHRDSFHREGNGSGLEVDH